MSDERDDELNRPLEEEEEMPRWGGTRASRVSRATDGSVVRAIPGLAKIYAAAWWRAGGWTAGTAGKAGSRVIRAARTGESPAELFQAGGAYAREYARRALGLVEDLPGVGRQEGENGDEGGSDTGTLRDRGGELLRRSADVNFDEDMHPAYAGILGQLAPDEGRILRVLAEDGPQPAVDVRTARPLGIGSHLISSGLNMIGAEAGCRHVERVHSYLNNLFRLGLIWFSREPVREPLRYQVLEAQPEVIEALREAGRGSTVRRSVELTSFGEDFCAFCLPLDAVESE